MGTNLHSTTRQAQSQLTEASLHTAEQESRLMEKTRLADEAAQFREQVTSRVEPILLSETR